MTSFSGARGYGNPRIGILRFRGSRCSVQLFTLQLKTLLCFPSFLGFCFCLFCLFVFLGGRVRSSLPFEDMDYVC